MSAINRYVEVYLAESESMKGQYAAINAFALAKVLNSIVHKQPYDRNDFQKINRMYKNYLNNFYAGKYEAAKKMFADIRTLNEVNMSFINSVVDKCETIVNNSEEDIAMSPFRWEKLCLGVEKI